MCNKAIGKAYCILCKLRIDTSTCTIYARFFHDVQYMRKIVLLSPMRKICARFVQGCTYFFNAQYMCKICARIYFILQCAIYAQDLHKIVLHSPVCNICTRFVQDCTYFSNVQYMRKIVVISPMRNICTKFPQDGTYFSNAQYMCKISTRLYLCLQCAIYVQYMHKIVVISPICNICARL